MRRGLQLSVVLFLLFAGGIVYGQQTSTGQSSVCAFPLRKAHELYQGHEVQQEIRANPIQGFLPVE
jgi:hypothetical protein